MVETIIWIISYNRKNEKTADISLGGFLYFNSRFANYIIRYIFKYFLTAIMLLNAPRKTPKAI